MTNIERFANLLIESSVYPKEDLEWRRSPGFAFGIDLIQKSTGKKVGHFHASFPQTDDEELIYAEMIKWHLNPGDEMVFDPDGDGDAMIPKRTLGAPKSNRPPRPVKDILDDIKAENKVFDTFQKRVEEDDGT